MLRNLPAITKNILLLNVVFMLFLWVAESNSPGLYSMLSGHYINSIFFEPFQIVTHMFMHSLTDPFHIFFNMFLLVMFGAHLERVWGAKRFFIFYISCGLGAFLLYNSIGVWQIMELKQELIAKGYDIAHFNMLVEDIGNRQISGSNPPEVIEYVQYNYSTLVGASGAIFGLLAGFAMLFPNTELYLMFIPVPIKAKYLIGVYLAFEVYSSVTNPNDQIAHLAHVGGAIVGIIFILIWRRTDRKNFY